MIVYGIKNCNTVKAALDWLNAHKVSHVFHDYKSKGITAEKLKTWSEQVGWERLVNKRGTTWRQLSEKEQASITDQAKAIELMIAKTSVIKRPLIENDDRVLTLGFDDAEFAKTFK